MPGTPWLRQICPFWDARRNCGDARSDSPAPEGDSGRVSLYGDAIRALRQVILLDERVRNSAIDLARLSQEVSDLRDRVSTGPADCLLLEGGDHGEQRNIVRHRRLSFCGSKACASPTG
jgi:hypothetical protein